MGWTLKIYERSSSRTIKRVPWIVIHKNLQSTVLAHFKQCVRAALRVLCAPSYRSCLQLTISGSERSVKKSRVYPLTDNSHRSHSEEQ